MEIDRLSAEERERVLTIFDEGIARVPDRPRVEVKAELEEIRRSRRRIQASRRPD